MGANNAKPGPPGPADADSKNQGMFGGWATRLFGSGSQVTGPVDMTVTGEGCQAITDLGWKKKENRYLGTSSMSEREVKEQKSVKSSVAIEQYQYKFPENERHLGFENVSAP